MALLEPVRTGLPCLSCTITALRIKVTVQSASHSEPTPIKVWWKPGMRYYLIENPDGRWGNSKSPVPVYCWVCPVDVPTLNFGSVSSLLTTGSSVEK